MTRFVGMSPRTARGVAELLRSDEETALPRPIHEQTQHRSQIIGGGGAAAKTGSVVIRAIPEGGDYGTVLQVQRITLTEAGQWAATGEMFDMPTFPLIPAIVYRLAILPEGEPQQMGDILPTCSIGGVEVVEPFFPMAPTVVRSDEPQRGCRPVIL